MRHLLWILFLVLFLSLGGQATAQDPPVAVPAVTLAATPDEVVSLPLTEEATQPTPKEILEKAAAAGTAVKDALVVQKDPKSTTQEKRMAWALAIALLLKVLLDIVRKRGGKLLNPQHLRLVLALVGLAVMVLQLFAGGSGVLEAIMTGLVAGPGAAALDAISALGRPQRWVAGKEKAAGKGSNA